MRAGRPQYWPTGKWLLTSAITECSPIISMPTDKTMRCSACQQIQPNADAWKEHIKTCPKRKRS